ncbi:MAG: PilZ domain-containing protein [Hyphomicrobiales bacterium]|nr:PilZ domain-containing protein [Hyphomicrobiales bacterium]
MLAHKLPLNEEKRRHRRVRVNLLGRFMLASGEEYPCQVINMSAGGAALITAVVGEPGERVIAYIDEIGRVEGKIVRNFDGGFAIAINATQRKRDKLANQLTWLANRTTLGMPEDRRHERVQPRNPYSRIKLPDGRTYACRVIDMSISGAAVAIQVRPALGTEVTLGRMRARVVRHFAEGVAVQFSDVQDPKRIVERLKAERSGGGEIALAG